MSNLAIIAVGGLILTAVWLGGLWQLLTRWRDQAARAARLKGLPLRQARGHLDDGDAIVVGLVVAKGETITSPLHKVECVYFTFSVREKKTHRTYRRGKMRTKVVWESRVGDTGIAPAFVGDDHVMIDLAFGGGPRIDIKVDARHTTGFLNGPDQNLQDTLQLRYGFDTEGLVFNKNLRVEERVLEVGDTVTLIGRFKTGPDGRTRMSPLSDDDGLWQITDRKPEAVIAAHQRAATLALLGLVAWVGVPVLIAVGAAAFTLLQR